MGTLGVVARLLALTIILIVSYALTETILYYGSSTSALLGVTPAPATPATQVFGDLLAIVAAMFVGALFTAPLALASQAEEKGKLDSPWHLSA